MQPRLRFPEFENIGYSVSALDAISEINPRVKELPSYFKYVDLESVKGGTIDFDTLIEYNADNAPSRAQRVIGNNEILYALVRPYQQNNIFIEHLDDSDYVASTGYAQIKANNINSRYLYYVLHTKKILDEVIKRCTGTSYPAINSSDLSSIDLDISSSVEEQAKIADFLSVVDKKITLLEQQQQAWKTYKQGMMQKLFSGELRFKDEKCKEFPEWRIQKAKSLFKSVTNKKYDGTLPILSVTQDKGVIPRDESGIDIKASQSSIESYKIIDKGDFVISLRSFQGGIEYSEIRGICSPAYTVLKNTENIYDDFYKYLFKSSNFITRLSLTVEGIRDGKQISYDNFGALNLIVPSLEEQKKIADYLSGLDAKIDNITAQLEQMREWKKGLLQQMFV